MCRNSYSRALRGNSYFGTSQIFFTNYLESSMNIGNILASALGDSFRNKRLWATSIVCTLIILLVLALSLGLYVAIASLSIGVEDAFNGGSDDRPIGVIVALIVSVLFMYVMIFVAIAFSQGALIDAVHQQDKAGEINVSRALRSGLLRCVPLFVTGLIAFLPLIVLFAVFTGAMVAATGLGDLDEETMSNFAGVMILPVFCVGLPLMIPALAILVHAERDVIVNDNGPLTALRTGWARLRKLWAETLVFGALFYFVQLILNFAATFVFYVLLFGVVGVTALVGSTSGTATSPTETLGIGLAALCGGLFTLVVVTLVYSWYNNLYALVWTRAFLQSAPAPTAAPTGGSPV
jgi:hypothetical protein